jgi:putative spermidine/putrescine transport system substrate-binding protein
MNRKFRTTYQISALTMAIGLLLAACGNAGAPKTVQTAGAPTCSKLDPSVTLNFINAGGAESDAITKGYIDPFTARTGIKVVLNPPNDLGRLQAEEKSGQITDSLFSTESTTLEVAKAAGLLAKLDYTKANFAPSIEAAKNDYAFGFQYYSTIMAWRAAATKGGSGPATWPEFFDSKKFPGHRGLADYPAFTLPIALLADGVAPNQLYPLDINRGFKFLEAHKKDVTVWWSAGAQPPLLLSSGELDYSMVWSGRIVTVADKNHLKFNFNQGLLDLAYIGIPKGAPHYCEALAFLAEVSQPVNQAKAAETLPYTGPALGIDKFLPKNHLDWFPTSTVNYSKQALQDAKWWYANGAEVQKRWEAFKLTR